MEDNHKAMLKAAGGAPSGYRHGSSGNTAHHGCCPFSQEQHHLHFTRPSPTALRLPPMQGGPIPTSSCPNVPPQPADSRPPSSFSCLWAPQ